MEYQQPNFFFQRNGQKTFYCNHQIQTISVILSFIGEGNIVTPGLSYIYYNYLLLTHLYILLLLRLNIICFAVKEAPLTNLVVENTVTNYMCVLK